MEITITALDFYNSPGYFGGRDCPLAKAMERVHNASYVQVVDGHYELGGVSYVTFKTFGGTLQHYAYDKAIWNERVYKSEYGKPITLNLVPYESPNNNG